jgi:hypothetical protein
VKHVPKVLAIGLVEAALDQPNPTNDLQRILRYILELCNHPARDRTSKTVMVDFD